MGFLELFQKKVSAPISNLSLPNIEILVPYINEFIKLQDNQRKGTSITGSQWIVYKDELDRLILLDFESISYYLERFFFKGNKSIRKSYFDNINLSTSSSMMACWMIGRKSALNDPEFNKEVIENEWLSSYMIPNKDKELLKSASYLVFYYWANVFSLYYESDNGKNTRFQKERHFKQMLGGIEDRCFKCFCDGALSIKKV